MVEPPSLTLQTSLFGASEPGVDRSFATLVRHPLDERSWVDHAPGWLHGADGLFAFLVETAPWAQRERRLYDKTRPEPRLTAFYGDDLPAPLREVCDALSARYGVEFDSVLLNLYRDGRDSVAWHGDRIARTVHDPNVATITLGHRRSFLLRPKGGGRSTRFDPGPGDLIVMGGASQTEWEHTVPKVASAGPRISITVRHSH